MRTIDNFQASNGNYSVSSRKQAISHLSNIQSITNKTSESKLKVLLSDIANKIIYF